MTQIRIYRPSKNAMQSRHAKNKKWVLEYVVQTPRVPDPLMGWASARDTANQIRLSFNTVEDAVAYAEKKGLDYTVQEPQKKKVKPRTYLDNFKYQAPKKKKR